jgi:ribosomal protein L17
VETVAQRVEVRARELRQTVQRLVTHAGDVQLVAERVESVVEQVIEKAKRSYRSVEDVAQLCAGRVRILVTDTYHLKARKTLLRSSRDFKVKADQIHLG